MENAKYTYIDIETLVDKLVAANKYIAPRPEFIFEHKKNTIGKNIKIEYSVVSADESIALSEEHEKTLHAMFSQIDESRRISYWVKRGENKDKDTIIEFELVLQRKSEKNPDQTEMEFEEGEEKNSENNSIVISKDEK